MKDESENLGYLTGEENEVSAFDIFSVDSGCGPVLTAADDGQGASRLDGAGG